MVYSKHFSKIENWVNSKKYNLRFGKSDYVDYENREVVLFKSQKNLIFSALHECGHVIIGSRRSYNKNFKSILKEEIDGRHANSNIYKYKKIKEEIDAWEEGYKLSKKLLLEIDKDEYDKYAAKCVATYIRQLY